MGKNPALGVFVAAIGCCCSAVGYTLQKWAHRRAAAHNAERAAAGLKPLPSYMFLQWPLGLLALVVGSAFAVVTFGLAGQAELAPMGAVTLVANTLLAWRVLGEPFTRLDALAIALMGAGE
jgi:drug/metabolite transporter (DMT)-like permease